MAETGKLKIKSYFGYAIADLGNNIAFAVTGSYLVLYYTDVLGAHFDAATAAKWGVAITVIMVLARIWDGINDPIMGYLVQRAKPTRFGKFRHYLLYGGLPLAVITVAMFLPLKGMSLAGCIAFALITYIAYGMLYTFVLVPYGSLATVMTRDSVERSNLSIARSIGGGIGGIPAGMLFPILVYSTVTTASGESVTALDGNKLSIAMAVIAVVMIISYVTGFFLTKENYPHPAETQQLNVKSALKSLIKNKPFIVMSFAGMLLIATSMYINTVYLYLFNVYYQRTGFMLYVTIATYAPMIAVIPFTRLIIKKLGKKEMCVYGLIISLVASLTMSIWRIPDPIIFIVFCFLQGAGISFFTLEIWAMAMDIIDYQELLTKRREEATTYALFTFMRKIGQALAAIVPSLLAAVGYVSAKGYAGQAKSTVESIYTLATVVPTILFALMLVLMIIYPLNKRKDSEMRSALTKLRAENSEKEVENA